jgi:chitinase
VLFAWTPDILPAQRQQPPAAIAAAPSPRATTEYAPYFYTWGWGNTAYPFTSLVELHRKTGLRAVTLAFVLSGGGCAPTRDIQAHRSDVAAFRSAGGKLKASFGGASGTYLEVACPDSRSLADAIEAFIDQTGIDVLDFDVEATAALTAPVNQRRAEALKAVQERRGTTIAVTLPASPDGVRAPGLGVLETLVRAGVKLSRVNLMTMNYDAVGGGKATLADLAISALTSAKTQLQIVIRGLSDADAWALLGATPMIGQNGGSGAVFTLADAQALVIFARRTRLGLLSFWAINRDQPGSGALGIVSRAQNRAFAFHEIFQTVTR